MPRGRPKKVPDMREGVPSAVPPEEARLFDSEEIRTEQEPEEENTEAETTSQIEAKPETKPEPKPEPKVEAKPEPPKDEAAEALKRALEAERKAAEYQRQLQLQALQYQEAQAKIAQHERDLGQSIRDRNVALVSRTEEAIRAAELQLNQALDDGDRAAQIEATKRLGSAQAALDNLQAELEQIEISRKQQEEIAKQPQQPQRRLAEGSDEEIDSWSLPAKETAWAKAHRDLVTGEANRRRMAALTNYLSTAGIGPGHPDFIPRLETEFGVRQPEPEPKPEPKRTPTVSAPVSRETPGSRQQSGKVELTAAEVEAAKIAGVSVAEYARQKQRIAQMKANGEYSVEERR